MHRKLKALRQLNNINQTETAKLLGLSLHTYNNKENGKTEFTLEEAKKLSDLFQITVDEIFFDDSVPNMRTSSA